MPRYALGFALLFALVAASAQAQIDWEGSVYPAGPTGFPIPDPTVYAGPLDSDLDGIVDWIFEAGNTLDLRFIDPDNPLGGNGLPWTAVDVWRGYDTEQNILVGNSGGTGTLTISAGGALRYQYLVLGGVSSNQNLGGGGDNSLNFEMGAPDDFELQTYLTQSDPGTGGNGTLIVSGNGSVFNNDPNVIPAEFQVALNLATPGFPPLDTLIVDLTAATTAGTGNFALTTRQLLLDDGYDVFVGLNGNGDLQVLNGGLVEIQDALMVAVDQGSTGTVLVDGAGSRLVAYGREELMDDGVVEASTSEATSFIGGRGVGAMTVSEGGSADFFNGLSIGAPTGDVAGYLNSDPSDGSGVLTVTGAGSRVTAYASRINDFDIFGGTTDIALAIGEFNDQPGGSLADPIDPLEGNTQPGTLIIADGGLVTTSFSQQYSTNEDDANAVIGAGGTVQLADGSFHVGNQLLSDGEISGYGTVRARSLDTSVYSVIRGGDSTAENPAASQPLRLQLNGEIGEVISGDLTTVDETNFINRGLVSGLVEIDAPGDIENYGDIAIGGEIFARTIHTTSTSTIVGGGSGQGLTIRLDNSDQADSPTPALQNYGLLAGKVNLQTPGAVVNGQEMSTPALPISGANGGEIAVDGTLEVGSFLNNRFGRVTVGTGESLRVLATGDPTTVAPVNAPVTGYAPIVENGTTPATAAIFGTPTVADFYTANLGEIVVNGGSFEIGLATETTTTTTTVTDVSLTEHVNLFRNARYVNTTGATSDFTVGTITANDGELKFRNGVYNTGVMAFTGGDNVVSGLVLNAGYIDYSGADFFPGIIVVTGNQTTVTFEDNVNNEGIISIGPYGNVVNFLGDLTGSGLLQIAQDFNLVSQGAAVVVDGLVDINGGAVSFFPFLTAGSTFDTGDTFALLQAGELSEESFFTELELPELAAGQYWDVIYDTIEDQILLEVVESIALGADFNGDGMVTQDDVDVWARNAGITSGASVIQGDADLDGDVDLADYGHLMDQLFTGVPVLVGSPVFAETPAVPEPAAALLCLLAVSAAASRRR